jgi:uncharacterized protein YndB with AHSA1/START domain
MAMTNPEFVYTIYIKTTPEKLWNAITNPEFTRQYWGGENISDWKKGAKWQHVGSDAQRTVKLVGEVLESVPPKLLVLTWPEPSDAADRSRHSRVTFEIEPIEDMVRLNVIHSNLQAGSEMARRIAAGWPRVLSSMKSFLETGEALNTWAGHEYACAGSATKVTAG